MSNDNAAVAPETQALPKCILVVEDNVALRFTLSEWLRICGYTVYEAATADEAVTVLGSPIAVDFVVTDVDMPGSMNGLGLVEYIKHKVAGVDVAVVSGNYPKQQITPDEIVFFKKPYDLQAISSHIAKTLKLKHPESSNE